MTSKHELEPMVHDWLHQSLDRIPDPTHRYAVIAAEINESPREQGGLWRWRATARREEAATTTRAMTRAGDARRTVPLLVVALALVAVGSLSMGRLLEGAPTAESGAEPEPPKLEIRDAEATLTWDHTTDRTAWIPGRFDRIAVDPSGALVVVQEPDSGELGSLVRLADVAGGSDAETIARTLPEHIGQYNLFDLQVGSNGRIWFNGGEGWATHADGEWHFADGDGHLADGPLQTLTLLRDGSAVALTEAPSRSGSELSANLVWLDAGGDPVASVKLPAHLTTDTWAMRDLGALAVAQTEHTTWVGGHLLEGGGLARLEQGTTEWIDAEPLGSDVPFEVNALAATAAGDALWALLVVETPGEERRAEPASQPWEPVLARYADGRWRTWGLADGLPKVTHRWAHWSPTPMDVAPDGSLWLADKSRGLVHFDGRTLTTLPLPDTGPNDFVDVADLAVDPSGTAYVLVAGSSDRAELYRAELPDPLDAEADQDPARQTTQQIETEDEMKRPLAVATIAATLMAAPAAAETAKDEFTGRFAYGPGIEDVEGEQYLQTGVAFSDPRLEGQVVLTANTELLDEGFYANSFRIENEEGAWQGGVEHGFYKGPGTSDAAKSIHVFEGEGGYVGLTAIAEVTLNGSVWTLEGFITDAVLPDQT